MAKVLDACCGSKMFWWDKENPEVVFADCREEETILCDGRKLVIKPDVLMDFRSMPFVDNSFSLVVFDPPHLVRAGKNSWLAKKYGTLPKDWKPYLKAGFDECMRVLKQDGVLVFKWNEEQIKLKEVLEVFGKWPLFGDKRSKTRWLIFMKDEEKVAPYCTHCGSGEYLHNEDGNRNDYCGQCGVRLDWSEVDSREEWKEQLLKKIDKYIEAYKTPPTGREVQGTVELLEQCKLLFK